METVFGSSNIWT